MPYYKPQPVSGPATQVRRVNGYAVFLLVLVLAGGIAFAFLYGPSYCGVIPGNAREATVLVIAREGEKPAQARSCAGFVINPQGYVLTLADALGGSSGKVFQVVVGRGTRHMQELEAWQVACGVVGTPSGDREWMVLQVDASAPLKAVEVANSDSLAVGSRVMAVGFTDGAPDQAGADGSPLKVTSGTVREAQDGVLSADTDMTESTPGGPLLDSSGNAVGLIVDTADGKCSAIPTASLVEVWQQFAGTSGQ